MPGVIMDSGNRNGSLSNHERERWPNGINGGTHGSEKVSDMGKGKDEAQQMSPINGLNGNFMANTSRQHSSSGDALPQDILDRISDLPAEINHITHSYLPLSMLLNRLAQQTHNRLSNKALELAQMPAPVSVANGNSSYMNAAEDNSVDNVNKKLNLLRFAQSAHTDWVKALVVTEWSRKAEEVSKLIDLKAHFDHQRFIYDTAFHEISEVKRDMMQARVPNPDLKTALAVLTTGKASWMPELDYIPPPPLSDKEVLKTLENLNTLLSIRLNLHEYKKTPWQFREYTIKSGRATFKVPGEFEVDLTIADEDPEAQLWFIDFRFLFFPTLIELPLNLLGFIENKVNSILPKDGLSGCYHFLHEIVLTHKISEFRRQARELAIGRWIEGLKVEQLNRSLSIQYWLDRYGRNGPKSFLILGVHSGRRKDGLPDPKENSRLSLRWFRDGKEMKDVEIPLDAVNISTELLLKTIVAKHVNHILTSIYEKLREKPLFATHEAALSLLTSDDDPSESSLNVQLTSKDHVTVYIEPVTGRFVFSPASRIITESEIKVNTKTIDPAADAHKFIENLRCGAIIEEIMMHGSTVGWIRNRGPGLRQDDLKPILPRDTLQIAWFQRRSWQKEWFVAVSVGMSGERWYLIEIANTPKTIISPSGIKVAAHIRIPVSSVSPVASYGFLSCLPMFAAALISHYTNLRALHRRRVSHQLRASLVPSPMSLPAVYIRLSSLLPSKNKSQRTGRPWARDFLKLTFQGLEQAPKKSLRLTANSSPNPAKLEDGSAPIEKPIPEERAIIVTEARLLSPLPAALLKSKENIDSDIAFHDRTGCFAFRLRSEIGDNVIPKLVERLLRVQRLIEFAEVFQKHQKSLHCEAVSLNKIAFTYPPRSTETSSEDRNLQTYDATVDFSAIDNNMRLILERGNPHIRVIDKLTSVLNSSSEGLDGVANLLTISLPVLRAFETIETAWESLSAHAEIFISVRAIDIYLIRYDLVPKAPNKPPRSIIFRVCLKHRRGQPFWHISRQQFQSSDRGESPSDELDVALRSEVFNAAGKPWAPFRTSAAGNLSSTEVCISKVDEVMRDLATRDKDIEIFEESRQQIQAHAHPPAQGQAQSQSQPQQQRQQQPQRQQIPPQAQMENLGNQNQIQQQRQQFSPQGQNQMQQRMPQMNMQQQRQHRSQSQNQHPQGRGQKREIVEID